MMYLEKRTGRFYSSLKEAVDVVCEEATKDGG